MIVAIEEQVESSLEEKMQKAFFTSLKLVHKSKLADGTYYSTRDLPDEVNYIAYAWADGLTHKYYQNMANCHCSSRAMVDFDIGKFEATIDNELLLMEKYLKILGEPIVVIPISNN